MFFWFPQVPAAAAEAAAEFAAAAQAAAAAEFAAAAVSVSFVIRPKLGKDHSIELKGYELAKREN